MAELVDALLWGGSDSIVVWVRVSFPSPENAIAEIAQLVEHNLAKVRVASSSLVFRSKKEDVSVDTSSFSFISFVILSVSEGFVYTNWCFYETESQIYLCVSVSLCSKRSVIRNGNSGLPISAFLLGCRLFRYVKSCHHTSGASWWYHLS